MKKVAVIGSFVVDLMARTPHLPEPGETVLGSFFRAGPGGKGSNQAIAAKRAGCNLAFSTKIGQDAFSAIALDAFQRDGISQEYVFQDPLAPTAVALISVDEQTSQNEIVVVLGACSTFNSQDLSALDTMLDGCEYLLLQLEINADALEQIIRMAYAKGIRIILNTAPVQKIPEDLYPMLYLVTPNEVEARILTGVACEDPDGCEKVAQAFFRKGVENVILTLGKRGAYVNDRNQQVFLENYDVPVLDTTGAGDAFNGGLLAGLSQGMDLMRAAAYGNVVSNLAVTKLGTAPAMPTKEEIDTFLHRNGITL